MLQDKQAKEEEGRRGQWAESNRPSKGVTKRQHRGSPVGHRGIASPPTRARVRSVGTARARRRHVVERGHVAQRQPNQAGGSQNTGGTAGARTSGIQQDVASDATGGFIGRQPVTPTAMYHHLDSTHDNTIIPTCSI